MGTQVFPSIKKPSPQSGLFLVPTRNTAAGQLPFEISGYSNSVFADQQCAPQTRLGCIRGVAWALGIQAGLMGLALGVWKLYSLLH